MKMINQKILSEIKITELDPNKYYIFTYNEQKTEEKEFSGYKAINELIQGFRNIFPDLRFCFCPDYKLNIKEVLDLESMKNLRIILDDWIKESESN